MIGIIVLVLAMAVPAFNALTGSRSIENATNIIAANLTRARLAAIQAQHPRGLVFYRDPNTDRAAIGLVAWNSYDSSIEVIPGTDLQFLPPGVSIAFRHRTSETNYAYRHYDDAEDLYGLILFNSRGHVMHQSYGIYADSQLGRQMQLNSDIPPPLIHFYSQPAFLLFERSPFDNATDQTEWLNNNASVLLVNRYNGTLTRSE